MDNSPNYIKKLAFIILKKPVCKPKYIHPSSDMFEKAHDSGD